MSERGGGYPTQALWNGIREGEGKGLRRTGVRRAAAAAPGPGRGGRVLYHGMRWAEPAAAGPKCALISGRQLRILEPPAARAGRLN